MIREKEKRRENEKRREKGEGKKETEGGWKGQGVRNVERSSRKVCGDEVNGKWEGKRGEKESGKSKGWELEG